MALLSPPRADTPIHGSRVQRALPIGMLFVVAMLLALITLPPLTSGRADALRARLDNDVQTFADALNATENSLQEMQAAARGYTLTQSPAFLEQYRAAQDSLEVRLPDLQQLGSRVDPTLDMPAGELVQVVERWEREGGDRQIALVQQGQFDQAAGEVAAGNSQALFDSFRSRVNNLQEQTNSTRTALRDQIDRLRTLQVALTSGLGILGLLSVAVIMISVRSLSALMRDLQAERERARALAGEARADRQRLQTVFDHTPEGMLLVEAPDGRISFSNPAAVALLGQSVSGAGLRAQPWAQRMFWPGGEPCPPDELPLLRSIEDGAACNGVELFVEQPDSQRIPVLLTSVPLLADDGAPRAAVAVFQDLRRLREVERLKSDFVALVSHELRTPLTAIQGCVQSLLSGGTIDGERTHDFLQIIAEQSERLQELIDNLLSLSQVEAGALRLHRELARPEQIVQGVLRQLRDRLAGLRVQTDLGPNLPQVSADSRRIEQVLFNLLDNARKFSPVGGMITVYAYHEQGSVTIGVRDQGPGIPFAERERVFERFYQLEQPATRNVGGSGLGLAICKAIVEAHGGQIELSNAPSGGADFSFTLPAMLPLGGQTDATVGAAVRLSTGATRVLVVDDDPALRRLLETTLPDAGYQVQGVVESQAALEAVVQQPPDIILLDVMLPGMDGFALCERLREWTKVPIIMLTARAAERDVVLGLQLGADDYVTKPFRSSELIARIEANLRRAQPDNVPNGLSLIQVGGLTIDLAQRLVTVDDATVELTPIEYQILSYLARHAGQVLTHEQILAEVWGEQYAGENHYLWVHVAHLRRKIEADSKQPRYLLTERGVGYRLAKE